MKRILILLLSTSFITAFAATPTTTEKSPEKAAAKLAATKPRVVKTDLFFDLVAQQMMLDLCKDNSVIRECYFQEKPACTTALQKVTTDCKTSLLASNPKTLNLGDPEQAKKFGKATGQCIGGGLRKDYKSNSSISCLVSAIKALVK